MEIMEWNEILKMYFIIQITVHVTLFVIIFVISPLVKWLNLL